MRRPDHQLAWLAEQARAEVPGDEAAARDWLRKRLIGWGLTRAEADREVRERMPTDDPSE